MTLRTLCLTGVLAGGLVASGLASALPYSFTVLYYSDATMTTAIGEMHVACNGTTTMLWGVKSRYRGSQQPEELCPGP
jgi:hypothetical protein